MATAHADEAGGAGFLGGFESGLIAFVFVAAIGATLIGLYTPALHVEQFWFFTRDITILSGIRQLIEGGQPVLGGLIFALSVALPLAKAATGLLISLFVRDAGSALQGLLAIFSFLGKWSLADVFILAIGVIVADGQLLTVANLGPGIYFFAAGATLSWIGTMALYGRARAALG
ncbi:MAG: paraquat-inducible protein A [Alphaproteobacteria bacterium]